MNARTRDQRSPSPCVERIESSILLVRGRKVLLDADLAALYGVETRVLNQAVKRNRERFPADFMFRSRRRSSRLGDHVLGKGKEILLKFGMVKVVLSSGSKLGAGVIRMHELQTCEMPLLRCCGSTVW